MSRPQFSAETAGGGGFARRPDRLTGPDLSGWTTPHGRG